MLWRCLMAAARQVSMRRVNLCPAEMCQPPKAAYELLTVAGWPVPRTL